MMKQNRTVNLRRGRSLKSLVGVSPAAVPSVVLSTALKASPYPMHAKGDLFETVFDLWSNPEDLRLTKVSLGYQGRVEDMERIGFGLHQAAATAVPKVALKHG